MYQEISASDICYSERFIRELATRYGFRPRDFSLVWDDGEFEVSRPIHELAIVAADGRRSAARIAHSAVIRQDPWQYIRQVDAALMSLARRHDTRGL
jgi:hypothetical protein